MREKIAKIILIFGSCFLIINGIGYLFNNLTFITIIDNPTGGGGRSISILVKVKLVIMFLKIELSKTFVGFLVRLLE